MPPIQEYWVMTRPESFGRVGPYTLDQIRSWVAEGILSSNVQICKEGDSFWSKASAIWLEARNIRGFFDFPEELKEQLHRRQGEDKAQDLIELNNGIEPATAFQLDCIEFLGIPIDRTKGLTSHRAKYLIKRFSEIDPELYHEYLSARGDSGPSVPHRIDERSPRPNMRGSAGNIVAAIASFFIPGLGQLAQRRVFFAFSCFAITAFLWLMAFVSLGLLSPVAFVVHILLGIAACIDAARWNGV